jgi:hypothetical protein
LFKHSVGLLMSKGTKISLAVLALCCAAVVAGGAGSIPFPSKRSATLAPARDGPEVPQRNQAAPGEDEELVEEAELDEEADEDGDIVLPEKRSQVRDGQAAGTEDENDPDATVGGEDGSDEHTDADVGEAVPQLPMRAPPPSKRRPRLADEKLGPPAPPESWSNEAIAAAKADCASLLDAVDYEFETLEPIKDGICGAPAPVSLSAVNLTSKVKIQPAGRMTCPLADALGRWLREVVQPRAKALLEDEIVALTNVAAYHCRPRYDDATQRMSHHAFANAIDISEFITAKGERINPLEHWSGEDARAKFLKEVHAGACGIFGTVLGPEANVAHRNHFHFDLAKRRRSAYCQ